MSDEITCSWKYISYWFIWFFFEIDYEQSIRMLENWILGGCLDRWLVISYLLSYLYSMCNVASSSSHPISWNFHFLRNLNGIEIDDFILFYLSSIGIYFTLILYFMVGGVEPLSTMFKDFLLIFLQIFWLWPFPFQSLL